MDVTIQTVSDRGGVRVLELASSDGTALPGYEAGAHIDVMLGNGLTRQYSLCCAAPNSKVFRIAVKREPQSRGGSAWLHEQAGVGTALRIGMPRNAFSLSLTAGMHVLFAGGIGVTPILSMAYALLRRGEPFRLFYFVRDADSVAFAAELLGGPLAPFVALRTAFTAEQTAQSIAADLAQAGIQGTHVYVCGPTPFMGAVVARATALFGSAAVHQESFGPTQGIGGTAAEELPFVLKLHRSGREIGVPAGRTALACLQEAGIDMDCSCEVGVCGTCRTVVLDGMPQHLDTVLAEQERRANNCFMPCVSRALTPVLVLDL